jgi:ubiquitin-protein ligase
MPHPDTPYGYGCFLFDILTTPDYPHHAPSVTTLTTGKGSVRFNPNLYNMGKVCLSLLGTWDGAEEESWTSQSTLLQLIVSLQSLIFVEWPHYNEPGAEGYANKAEAKRYNARIRAKTLQWAMIDVLKHPPKGFEYVVKVHFYTHRQAILAMLDRWAKDGVSTGPDLDSLKKDTKVFKKMLEELELPEPPAEEESEEEDSEWSE